ncbi:MFS transporter, NNP family, nitrate/nitrite transporter [Rhodocyclaceae bacterium]|nr:MFS transporter, NNP family, nitrate/nitrite transporter [Rhodocyclaceae bacterium]
MRYTRELKEKAVREIKEGGRALLEVAWELGISTTTLRNWIRAAETKAKTQGSVKKVAAALSREKYSESSQRMRLLIHALEQSPATIIVTDADGCILYANPKFAETTGYTLAEVIGKTPSLLKSGHTQPEEYRSLWKTINAGKEWRGEFHNRRKDGTLYWERASISPVFDAKGNIANFMAVKENITEFKEAEESRQRTEARFRAVVTALAEGVLLFDADGRIVLANAAAERMLGHGGGQMLGRRLEELNLRWLSERGESVAPSAHPVRRALEKGEAVRQEIYGVINPANQVYWLSTSAGSVRDGENGAAVVLSFSDITERRNGEERLKVVGAVFDNSVEAIMITDGNNRIVSVNGAFAEITGYTLDEVVGKTPRLLSSGKHDAAFFKDMWQGLAATGRWQGQVWNRRKNGRPYLAWLSISAVRDAEGSVAQYVALFFDMGEPRA